MTPLRWVLLLLTIAAAVLVFYALLFESSDLKLPLLVSGLAVMAITMGILGFALASTAVQMGEAGRGGMGLLAAFIGGLFVLGAAGSLAAAIVLGILAAA